VKFGFIAKHRGIWPTRWLCEALDASRSGFYEWAERPRSEHARQDDRLLGAIRRSVTESDATYGYRRVWRDLRAWGERCGRDRTARLMRQAGFYGRRRRRYSPQDAGARSEHLIARNLLERRFAASGPKRQWVADFTYLWTAEGWLYVAVVLDLYSRRAVGWSMSSTMTAQLVTDALTMALWRRGKPTQLLHHSDQGSQYTSELFQRLLADHGITCSMSRRGDCWDNAAMESFFSTMKTERTSKRNYTTRDEARADVFDYIERFYNHRRRHSTLGYVSPVEFEQVTSL
jgi:putative transposase